MTETVKGLLYATFKVKLIFNIRPKSKQHQKSTLNAETQPCLIIETCDIMPLVSLSEICELLIMM